MTAAPATQEHATYDFHSLYGHSPRTAQIRDYRRVEVGKMLLARVPVRVMAERLHVSTNTVNNDIKVIERWWAESAIKDRAALIERESVKLDELESWWWERACFDEGALDSVLRIMAARAKMQGLHVATPAEEAQRSVDEARAQALEVITQELTRRRELAARAQLANGEAIDV